MFFSEINEGGSWKHNVPRKRSSSRLKFSPLLDMVAGPSSAIATAYGLIFRCILVGEPLLMSMDVR
jgi:hypothetical protein